MITKKKMITNSEVKITLTDKTAKVVEAYLAKMNNRYEKKMERKEKRMLELKGYE